MSREYLIPSKIYIKVHSKEKMAVNHLCRLVSKEYTREPDVSLSTYIMCFISTVY